MRMEKEIPDVKFLTARQSGMLHNALILVPLDFSDTATKALKYAAALAEEFKARIRVLYVMEPASLREFTGAYPHGSDNDELISVCKRKLLASADKCDVRRDLIEDTTVRRGPAYREIVAEAREMGADLIVINTHGNSGLNRLLLGSVAEHIVQHAPCPVLVVREEEHDFIP